MRSVAINSTRDVGRVLLVLIEGPFEKVVKAKENIMSAAITKGIIKRTHGLICINIDLNICCFLVLKSCDNQPSFPKRFLQLFIPLTCFCHAP